MHYGEDIGSTKASQHLKGIQKEMNKKKKGKFRKKKNNVDKACDNPTLLHKSI